MVKTVRLASLSKEKFSEEDEEKGKEFKRKRVGTEVVFSRGDAKFKKTKISDIEVFYPDAF